MKKLLLLGFLPVLSLAQTQKGNDINGEGAFDQSGKKIALSADGSIIAIGAEGNDENGTSSDAGHVRVYRVNNDNWVQVGQDINGEADNDRSGSSVALSSDGNIIAIGAFRNDGQFTEDWLGRSMSFQKTDTSPFLNRNAKRLDVLNQMFGEDFFWPHLNISKHPSAG